MHKHNNIDKVLAFMVLLTQIKRKPHATMSNENGPHVPQQPPEGQPQAAPNTNLVLNDGLDVPDFAGVSNRDPQAADEQRNRMARAPHVVIPEGEIGRAVQDNSDNQGTPENDNNTSGDPAGEPRPDTPRHGFVFDGDGDTRNEPPVARPQPRRPQPDDTVQRLNILNNGGSAGEPPRQPLGQGAGATAVNGPTAVMPSRTRRPESDTGANADDSAANPAPTPPQTPDHGGQILPFGTRVPKWRRYMQGVQNGRESRPHNPEPEPNADSNGVNATTQNPAPDPNTGAPDTQNQPAQPDPYDPAWLNGPGPAAGNTPPAPVFPPLHQGRGRAPVPPAAPPAAPVTPPTPSPTPAPTPATPPAAPNTGGNAPTPPQPDEDLSHLNSEFDRQIHHELRQLINEHTDGRGVLNETAMIADLQDWHSSNRREYAVVAARRGTHVFTLRAGTRSRDLNRIRDNYQMTHALLGVVDALQVARETGSLDANGRVVDNLTFYEDIRERTLAGELGIDNSTGRPLRTMSELDLLYAQVEREYLSNSGVRYDDQGNQVHNRRVRLQRKWSEWSEQGWTGRLKKMGVVAGLGLAATALASSGVGAISAGAVGTTLLATRAARTAGGVKLDMISNNLTKAEDKLRKQRERSMRTIQENIDFGRFDSSNVLLSDSVAEQANRDIRRHRGKAGVAAALAALTLGGGETLRHALPDSIEDFFARDKSEIQTNNGGNPADDHEGLRNGGTHGEGGGTDKPEKGGSGAADKQEPGRGNHNPTDDQRDKDSQRNHNDAATHTINVGDNSTIYDAFNNAGVNFGDVMEMADHAQANGDLRVHDAGGGTFWYEVKTPDGGWTSNNAQVAEVLFKQMEEAGLDQDKYKLAA